MEQNIPPRYTSDAFLGRNNLMTASSTRQKSARLRRAFMGRQTLSHGETVIMENTKHGSCLCGSVHIKVVLISSKTNACHCRMCRIWGGGPFMAINCGSNITIEGEEYISTFNSSDWAERGFCSKCGTHLFYRLRRIDQYSVPAGLFDDQGCIEMESQFFIDKKPSYYSFSNSTIELTEAQVFASYAPE